MLLKILVLVCAAELTPQDCTTQTAFDVIRGPDAANEAMCGMQAQAYLAHTSLAPQSGSAYMKVICKRDAPIATAAQYLMGRQDLQ